MLTSIAKFDESAQVIRSSTSLQPFAEPPVRSPHSTLLKGAKIVQVADDDGPWCFFATHMELDDVVIRASHATSSMLAPTTTPNLWAILVSPAALVPPQQAIETQLAFAKSLEREYADSAALEAEMQWPLGEDD